MTELKYARTELLNIAYYDHGNCDGFPVVLLHGWPDDALTWGRVSPELIDAGFRVIVPYLRGFGPTRFISAETPRTGQLAALGRDVVELADALQLGRFALVGHDWGARAAAIATTARTLPVTFGKSGRRTGKSLLRNLMRLPRRLRIRIGSKSLFTPIAIDGATRWEIRTMPMSRNDLILHPRYECPHSYCTAPTIHATIPLPPKGKSDFSPDAMHASCCPALDTFRNGNPPLRLQTSWWPSYRTEIRSSKSKISLCQIDSRRRFL